MEGWTEFITRHEESGRIRGGQLDFKRPGKPTHNSYFESFNGKLRDECLSVHQFADLGDAQASIEIWQHDYNEHRLHGALWHLTPQEYALQPGLRKPSPSRCDLSADETKVRRRGFLAVICLQKGLTSLPALASGLPADAISQRGRVDVLRVTPPNWERISV